MLNSFFLNPWLLLGLPAVLVPVIIHLLNRRRYEVIDWGAMQFLQFSEVTRRRLFLEELLLMLLRMGLIAVLVLALAGPFVTTSSIARWGPRANRDVVLVFDGSYSMASTGPDGIPQEKAKEWALKFVADSTPGDSMAILQAKEQVVPLLPQSSQDAERLRKNIEELPQPTGCCDWRPALQAAIGILSRSQRAEREIILLTDGQRFGWADSDSLLRWSLLSPALVGWAESSRPTRGLPVGLEDSAHPADFRIRVVNVATERPADLPNWSLTPLQTNRVLAPQGRSIAFRTAIDLHGQKEHAPPHRVRLEVDGRFIRDLEVPSAASLRNGRLPLGFNHTFASPGCHLVSVVLEPDPPIEERAANYVARDNLPGDNRQDFAIEIVRKLPVMIVDGRAGARPLSENVDFLRQALEARDPAPVVGSRVVPINEFDPATLSAPETNKAGETSSRPRVLILRDIPELTAAQREAITLFLAEGGGVLITHGPRALAESYNDNLHRGGKGWLPARLESIVHESAHPAAGLSNHPALQLFLDNRDDGQATSSFPQLARVRFSNWWKLTPPGRNSAGVQLAGLRTDTAEHPLVVEWIDPQRAGRLLQLAVPLDDSWGGEIVRSESFVPLVHELVYYLAGARSTEFNLEPGQPLRYRLDSVSEIEQCKLEMPLGEMLPLREAFAGRGRQGGDESAILASVDRQPRGPMLRIEGIRETGVYRLHTGSDRVAYYVVRSKTMEESDLTPCSHEELSKVAKLVSGMEYWNDREETTDEWIREDHRQEVWSWLLLGVIALLCGEVLLTRRIVMNR